MVFFFSRLPRCFNTPAGLRATLVEQEMERKATRMRSMVLPINENVLQLSNQNRSGRYLVTWMTNYLASLLRKLMAAFKIHRSMMRCIKEGRKLFACFILIFVTLTSFLVLNFLEEPLFQMRRATRKVPVCKDPNIIYIDGRLECRNMKSGRYLSYQPPGGGWNNQRVAFENAVVMAKLLNRTLIVHPLAPHQEILKLKKRRKIAAGYEIYNMLPKDKLLALSNVIDLRRLSKLIPVKEFTSNHNEFHKVYSKLKWKTVCHNGLFGTWVDIVPKRKEKEKWEIIEEYMLSLPSSGEIPLYRRICLKDEEDFGSNASTRRPLWGILEELSDRTEDLIYFSEGSLYNRKFIFFNRETVLNAHRWIAQFVRFAPDITNRVMAVLQKLGHPYNAVHIRRTDHPSSFRIRQDFWLRQLQIRSALNLTKTLYIASDERNRTWFRPFRDAGYNLYFADDFAEQLRLTTIPTTMVQDVLGLCEQLICAHADHFVGSYYSTFTLYIKRLRRQLSRNRGMLIDAYSSIIWAGSRQMGR